MRARGPHIAALLAAFAVAPSVQGAPTPGPEDLNHLPPCTGKSRFKLLAPSKLPHKYLAGFAIVDPRDPLRGSEPAEGFVRVAVEPPPGGRLRYRYRGNADRSELGAKHRRVFRLRFSPGDTGARVTVAFDEGYGSGGPSCVRRFVRDVKVMPPDGVRVRVKSVRVVGRRSIRVRGRMSGRPGRSAALLTIWTPSPYNVRFQFRVRAKRGRFDRTVTQRLRIITRKGHFRIRKYFPGSFSDPVPVDDSRF